MEKRRPMNGTDDIRINVQDSTELKYWSNKFGVSRDEVKSAVNAVGDSLTEVQKKLQPKPLV